MKTGMPPEDPKTNSNSSRQQFWRQLAGPAFMLLAIVVLGRLVGSQWPQWEAAIAESGQTGHALFVGSFVLLTVLCFPVSVLGFSAGAMFGPLQGLLLIFPGGLVAGVLMFLLARWVLRSRIQALVCSRPRLAALDRLARRQAYKLNLLTRLSPFNYGLASYTLASGSTTFRAYLVGLLATLPSMIAHVTLGHLAAGRQPGDSGGIVTGPLRWVLLGLGILFLGALAWTTGRMLHVAGQHGRDSERDASIGKVSR